MDVTGNEIPKELHGVMTKVLLKKMFNEDLQEVMGTLQSAFTDFAEDKITAAEFSNKAAELRTQFLALREAIASANEAVEAEKAAARAAGVNIL